MKWLKKFEKFQHMMEDFKTKFPDEISIYTNNGSFKLKRGETTLEADVIRVDYYHSTFNNKNNNSLSDGEPDYVCFDVHIINSPLKIITDISYGDSIVSQFTITKNGIKIGNYNGIGSKLDPKTHFGFSDETIKELINFYHLLGDFKLKPSDFTFIDKYFDSYKESVKIIPLNNKKLLIIDKGSDRIEYLKDWLITRGINYELSEKLPESLNKYLGVIVCDKELEKEIKQIELPTLFIGDGFFGFLSLFGITPIKLKTRLHDNKLISDPSGKLFNNIDTKTNQFNFSIEYIIKVIPDNFKITSYLKKYPSSFELNNFYGCIFNPEMSETTYQFLDNFMEIVKPVQSELDKLKNIKENYETL
jgi:hypothetical protein